MASQSFSQLVNTKEVLASIQNTMTAKQAADFKTAIITLYNTSDSFKCLYLLACLIVVVFSAV